LKAITDQIEAIGIIPVIVIDDPADAPSLTGALAEAGLPIAEFTFRTAAGPEAVRSAASAHPDVLIGAGTVTTVEQVDRAVDAGARFVVSPGLDERVVRRSVERGVLPIPGCSTASELMTAQELGLDVVKFFPAEALGGLRMLQALAAPFPGMRFIPTGGVDASSARRYLSDRRVLAVGGSWMVPRELLRSRDWHALRSLAAEAIRTAHGFALAHVGLSSADATDAERIARQFSSIFGFGVRVGNSSVFAGPGIEVVKGRSRGEFGHIAISTANVRRAVAYLAVAGLEVDPGSEKHDAAGNIKAVYLRQQLAGFAIHLLQED
jgi:2-dehydro-3-deoxyphosphogluconate aldolase / (4S)-4-hydroxy-2-oxoglutarate aldolase